MLTGVLLQILFWHFMWFVYYTCYSFSVESVARILAQMMMEFKGIYCTKWQTNSGATSKMAF